MLYLLKAQRVNMGTLAIIALLMGIAFLTSHAPDHALLWQRLLFASLALSAFASIYSYWRFVKITEIPTATIAAAAQGVIELQGIASTTKPLLTPYHGIACVWYRAWVFANRMPNKDEGILQLPANKRLLHYTESDVTFTLDDGTDTCTINPKGAEIVHFETRTAFKNEHRYVEEYLPANQHLYVVGVLNTLHHQTDAQRLNADVMHILAELKSQPTKMRNRYDHNRNGKIDVDEWELARQDAITEATTKQMMRAHTSHFTLAKPQGNHLFVISAESAAYLRNRYQFWIWIHLAIFLSLATLFSLSLKAPSII